MLSRVEIIISSDLENIFSKIKGLGIFFLQKKKTKSVFLFLFYLVHGKIIDVEGNCRRKDVTSNCCFFFFNWEKLQHVGEQLLSHD